MAIRDLQTTLTEMGRIRLGQKVKTGSGALRPDKLDTFRFTSAAEHLIIEIAALYGGVVKPWDGGRGKQWEVIVDSALIPIYLPRQSIEPWYEGWRNGVCIRRCDGVFDTIHDAPCSCDPEERDCKPTTRVNVMLADVPGLGVWRVESHGYYAASELTQLADLVAGISMPLPGRLMLEARGRKFFNRKTQKVEVRDYFVPVILIDSVTSRQVQIGGDALTQALQMSNNATAAVEAAPAARAIEAGPAAPAGPDPAVIERGLKAIGSATPDQMADMRERIEKLGAPQELVDAFRARLEDHAVAEEAASYAREAEAAEASQKERTEKLETEAGADIKEGEAVTAADATAATAADATADDGDRETALMDLLGAAGKAKPGTKALDDKIMERFGVARMECTAAQFSELAAELKGEAR